LTFDKKIGEVLTAKQKSIIDSIFDEEKLREEKNDGYYVIPLVNLYISLLYQIIYQSQLFYSLPVLHLTHTIYKQREQGSAGVLALPCSLFIIPVLLLFQSSFKIPCFACL